MYPKSVHFFLVLISSGVCHSLTIHSQVEGHVSVGDYECSTVT